MKIEIAVADDGSYWFAPAGTGWLGPAWPWRPLGALSPQATKFLAPLLDAERRLR